MGGGDLNLKKSWHPSTMKNMERVWKAEQKDSEEKKRIAELQREIVAERSREDMQKYAEDTGVVKKKDDMKLEWMYKGPRELVNTEDYLLGKSVDKNFEQMQREQRNNPSTSQDCEGLPSAVRLATASVFNDQVDIARKLNEDPLMAIRKRAIEMRQQLYNNPVKMKQIQQLVATSKHNKKHKKDKKHKKKRKSKKSHKKSESSDSDGAQDCDKILDALLAAKYSKLRDVIKDKDILRKLGESSDDSDSEVEHIRSRTSRMEWDQREGSHNRKRSTSPSRSHNKTKTNSHKMLQKNRDTSRRRSLERNRNDVKLAQESRDRHYRKSSGSHNADRGLDKGAKSEKEKKLNSKRKGRSSGESSYESDQDDNEAKKKKKCDVPSGQGTSHYDNHRSRDDSEPRYQKSYGLVMADGSKPVPKVRPVEVEQHNADQPAKPSQWKRPERKKLSAEELEQRRKEMIDNANWRDKQREANVRRYRQEDQHERLQHEKEFDRDFLRKQLSHATSQASVEGRIKSKLNNIQRSERAMDKNFARR